MTALNSHPSRPLFVAQHVTSNTTLREIKLLRELSHVNIVALRDTFLNMSNMSCALVFDYGNSHTTPLPVRH